MIVDRKYDRNCDIGCFELAYKQTLTSVPQYIGISLCVEGQAVNRRHYVDLSKDVMSHMQSTPRNFIIKNTKKMTTDSPDFVRSKPDAGSVLGGGEACNGKLPFSKLTPKRSPDSKSLTHVSRSVLPNSVKNEGFVKIGRCRTEVKIPSKQTLPVSCVEHVYRPSRARVELSRKLNDFTIGLSSSDYLHHSQKIQHGVADSPLLRPFPFNRGESGGLLMIKGEKGKNMSFVTIFPYFFILIVNKMDHL